MRDGLAVEDVMRSHVYCIGPDASVQAAAYRLLVHNIESLVVIDRERVVGIVTVRDLLKSVLPSPQEIMSADRLSDASNLLQLARDRFDLLVGEVMTKNVRTIAPSVSVTRALGTMLAHRFRRLPVVDPATDHLVGIITQRDVFSMVFLEPIGSQPATGWPTPDTMGTQGSR